MFVLTFNSAITLKSVFQSLYFPFSIPVSYQCHSSMQGLSVHTLQAFIALSFGVALISKSVAVCNLFLGKPSWVSFVSSEAQKAVQWTRYRLE